MYVPLFYTPPRTYELPSQTIISVWLKIQDSKTLHENLWLICYKNMIHFCATMSSVQTELLLKKEFEQFSTDYPFYCIKYLN